MKITRRQLIASMGGLALTAAGIDATLIEPRRHEVTRHRLGRAAGDAGDEAGPAIRIVQLTDLHLRGIGEHVEEIAETAIRLNPDIIVLTGDSVDRYEGIPDLRAFLSLLDTDAALYAIMGNWEHWAGLGTERLRAAFAEAGCELLVNQSVLHRHEGAELLITGLDDLVAGRPDTHAALAGAPPAPNHLLLAHCPVHRDVLGLDEVRGAAAGTQRFAPDCVLSGHTHGGQVAFFGWAPVLPRGSRPYLAGWYRDASPPMYVSRGLGTTGLPIRFGSVPEVAVFDWSLSS